MNISRNLENEFILSKIPFTARLRNIGKTNRKQALVNHPDKGGEEAEFKRLSNGYEKVTKCINELLKLFPELYEE